VSENVWNRRQSVAVKGRKENANVKKHMNVNGRNVVKEDNEKQKNTTHGIVTEMAIRGKEIKKVWSLFLVPSLQLFLRKTWRT
jgi:hypothetical protein